MNQKWTPFSWKDKTALHQPKYLDEKTLERTVKKMKKLPPLVFAGEVRNLKKELAKCVDGKGFFTSAGDCAESFAEFVQIILEIRLELLCKWLLYFLLRLVFQL